MPKMTSTAVWSWILTPMIWAVLLAGGWAVSTLRNFATEYTRLATENEQMRFADERMERSRTNFQQPGVTSEEITWIQAISNDYGIPADLLYAMRKTENGGRGLYLGSNWIDPEIRQRYPPLWWQFAQAAKKWNLNLNRTAMSDPELCHRSLWSFARQWNPDPVSWTASVMDNLDRTRWNGLAVTEKPRKAPSRSKAGGGGHKTPKHSSKEKKR